MKLRHRILSLVLAISILFTMALPAFAETAKSYPVMLGRHGSQFTITTASGTDTINNFFQPQEPMTVGDTLTSRYGITAVSDPTDVSGGLGTFVGWRVLGVSEDGNSTEVLSSGFLDSDAMLRFPVPDND